MRVQNLAKPTCRNHVELIYSSGQTYKIRNAKDVLYIQDEGVVLIHTSEETKNELECGIVKTSKTINTTRIDVSILSGLVVSHCTDDAMNRYTMNTFLTFVSRGEMFGGVMPKNEYQIVDYGSVYTENLVAAQKDVEKFVGDVQDWRPEEENYGSDNI